MSDWLQLHIFPHAHTIPIELFLFVASLLEEIIPPIPSFPVMFMAGNLARIQDYTVASLVILVIIGATGRTIGAITVYRIVDKLEDIFVLKYGPRFNLKPGQLETFGEKLGKGPRDYIILTALRAFPFFPSTIISIGSGLIRISLKLFIVSTFLGALLRDSFYLYVGFAGTKIVFAYFSEMEEFRLSIKVVLIISSILVISYLLFKRYRENRSNANPTSNDET